VFVNNLIGNAQQILCRQSQKLGVSPIAADNPKDRTFRAVTRITGSTEFTLAASGIYFTNNSLIYERLVRTVFNHANELVSDSSFESCVPSSDFEIGVTDSR
jgi:hypothetical protein